MKVIFVRSPYTITVDEATQLLTKVELYIYKGNESAPATPTIVLEKQIPDTVNRACYFNISPYIKDYIENIAPTSVEPTDEDFDMWRKAVAVTYYKADVNDDWTELDVVELVAVNGYTNYMGGYNQDITTDVLCLINSDVKLKRGDNNQYFNALIDFDNIAGYDLVYRYRKLNNSTIDNVTVLTSSNDSGVYMVKVPYRTETSGLENGNSVQVRLNTSGDVPAQPFVYFLNEDVCLYTPIKCTFINKFGGWQYLTFFKASSTSYDTKAKAYNLLADSVDYNPLRGQKKNFNFEQTQKIKVNTGWVDENYIELLADLTNSETVLIDNIPATLTSRQIEKKTRLKDKMINYEMEFEYAFNLINDVN
jgi:hypothetical protein